MDILCNLIVPVLHLKGKGQDVKYQFTALKRRRFTHSSSGTCNSSIQFLIFVFITPLLLRFFHHHLPPHLPLQRYSTNTHTQPSCSPKPSPPNNQPQCVPAAPSNTPSASIPTGPHGLSAKPPRNQASPATNAQTRPQVRRQRATRRSARGVRSLIGS